MLESKRCWPDLVLVLFSNSKSELCWDSKRARRSGFVRAQIKAGDKPTRLLLSSTAILNLVCHVSLVSHLYQKPALLLITNTHSVCSLIPTSSVCCPTPNGSYENYDIRLYLIYGHSKTYARRLMEYLLIQHFRPLSRIHLRCAERRAVSTACIVFANAC